MAKGYVRAIVGAGAGAILGAAITLAFGAHAIGVIVGAVFGVNLGPIAEWRDGLAYGAIIGGIVGLVNGLMSAYNGSRLTHLMVSASMGALIGAIWGAAVGRVFRDNEGDRRR